MIGNIENVKIISTFHHKSKPYAKIERRKTHGFIFKIIGFAEYSTKKSVYRVNEGELIFLPKGSVYEFVSDGGMYTSINFEANMENPEITVYSLKDFQSANYMLRSFTETWNFGNLSDRYKCVSNFYDLLSYISHLDSLGTKDAENYRIIEPAIEYLKKHIYETTFKIDKLHRICGISDTYFRRIFISRFAKTPQEYVLSERLAHAKAIVESGDFDSIKTVSEAVGYSDPLYFSKAFRRRYGFPPSSINK